MFSHQIYQQNRQAAEANSRPALHQSGPMRPIGLFASPTTRDAPNAAAASALTQRGAPRPPPVPQQQQQQPGAPVGPYRSSVMSASSSTGATQPSQSQQRATYSSDCAPLSFGSSLSTTGVSPGAGTTWMKSSEELGSYGTQSSATSSRFISTKIDGGEVINAENDTQSVATACAASSTGTYGLTNELLSDHVSLAPVPSHAERVALATKSDKDAWKTVDRTWYPEFHMAAVANWLSVPGGLCFHNGDYHVFYQHNPFGTEWGNMHWGHAVSKDLVHWQHLPVALAPGDPYDRDGCFSGSAVSYKGKLYLFYTGNTWFQGEGDSNIYQMQCLAVSEDGVHFEKKGPIARPPAKYRHCRDPKVWQREDGMWCMVLGARDVAKDLGQLLLYTTDDLTRWNDTEFMIVSKTEDRNAFMWECPDFFPYKSVPSSAAGHFGGQVNRLPVHNPSILPRDGGATNTYALLFCPQGLQPDKYRNRNRFQAGTLLGKFVLEPVGRSMSITSADGNAPFDERGRAHGATDFFGAAQTHAYAPAAVKQRGFGGNQNAKFVVTRQFREIDHGSDFYAPQSFVAPDGRRIVMAWMDMWASPMPSREHGWSGCVTLPRELVITEEGDVRLLPIRELESLRTAGIEVTAQEIEDDSELPLVEDCTAYEVEVTFNVERSSAEKYGLWLGSGAEIYVDAQSERLVVNRHYPEYMLSGNRSCALPCATELRLRVYFDRSSMEVFVNDGEACFSTRIYPNANDRALRLFSINGTTEVVAGTVWRLDQEVISSL